MSEETTPQQKKEDVVKQFDYYEIVGVITPGAVILFGAAAVYWTDKLQSLAKDLSAGALGVFIILAYAAGSLAQGFGSIVEHLWWFGFGGQPTDWVRNGKGRLFAPSQREKLIEKLKDDFGMIQGEDGSIDEAEWTTAVRRARSAVFAKGMQGRIQIFNSNYGMCRGLVAAFVILSIATLCAHGTESWPIAVTCVAFACVALYRMHRFGRHYATELLTQYLNLELPGKSSIGPEMPPIQPVHAIPTPI